MAAELKPQNAALAEKRDKAIQTRHARLMASQQQIQKPTVAETVPPLAQKISLPRRQLPRWLVVTLIGVGGIVMLLLGVWMGTTLARRNDLVPTKLPATVGRRS